MALGEDEGLLSTPPSFFFEVYKSRGPQLCVVVFLFACGGTLTERV